jgi:hypothetical protein
MQTTVENKHSATAQDNCRLQEPQHPSLAPSNAAASLHFLCVGPSKDVTMCNCQYIVYLMGCAECLLMQATGENEHSATAQDNCRLQEPQHPLYGHIQCCCITAFPQCGSIKECYNGQLPIHSVLDCVKCLLIQAACENEHSATARDNCRLQDP